MDDVDDAHGLVVEPVRRIVIADSPRDTPNDFLKVNVGAGGDFTSDQYHARGREGLAGNSAVGIFGQACIKDRVGHLIGQFVRVSFGNGFRRKKGASNAHMVCCTSKKSPAQLFIFIANQQFFTGNRDHRRLDQRQDPFQLANQHLAASPAVGTDT